MNKKCIKKANAIVKDQSYVLYNTPKELLDKLKLPLGRLEVVGKYLHFEINIIFKF